MQLLRDAHTGAVEFTDIVRVVALRILWAQDEIRGPDQRQRLVLDLQRRQDLKRNKGRSGRSGQGKIRTREDLDKGRSGDKARSEDRDKATTELQSSDTGKTNESAEQKKKKSQSDQLKENLLNQTYSALNQPNKEYTQTRQIEINKNTNLGQILLELFHELRKLGIIGLCEKRPSNHHIAKTNKTKRKTRTKHKRRARKHLLSPLLSSPLSRLS